MYVLGCAALALLSVPCIGVIAAIAIPAFTSYTRRARSIEARTNVAIIVRGVESVCATGALPGPAGPTPATPGSERQVATFGPEWASVGFSPTEPVYYSYSITRASPSTVVVAAEGDLNGDGARSRFESMCMLAGASCTCTPVVVTNELD